MGWLTKNLSGITCCTFLITVTYIVIRKKELEKIQILARIEILNRTYVPSGLIKNVKSLEKRLVKLELQNKLRAKELMSVRRKLRTKLGGNTDATDVGVRFSLPSIYNALPHLVGHEDALKPFRRFSKERKGVSLAFGIPTVRRQRESYLLDTLSSMIKALSAVDRETCLIIVYIAETNLAYVDQIMLGIQKKFPDALNSGLLEVIAPSPNYYPNLDHLPSTFNDPPARIRWRAKQNLDYAYLMMYAQSRASFYVQMEDDIIASEGYASTINAFIAQQHTNSWFMLEFSKLGFIGKLFHSEDLSILVNFFLIFYKDKPNDWLLDHVFYVKVCDPEKNNKYCEREKRKLKIKFKPSLFQHVGKESSLKGKRQNLIDKDFKKQPLFQAHLNPKATIKTNFQKYQQHTAIRGYLGQTFFWALPSSKNTQLRIIFHQPQMVKSFLFKSGNIEHPGDILTNASVEVLREETYVNRWALENRKRHERGQTGESNEVFIPDADYVRVGSFDKKGVAEQSLKKPLQLIREVVIRVQSKSNWVIIREFFIDTVR